MKADMMIEDSETDPPIDPQEDARGMEGRSMRPLMIVLPSAVAALAAALLIGWVEVSAVPRTDAAAALIPQIPALLLVLLAVYAAGAAVLTAAGLLADALRLRRRFAGAAAYRATVLDWIEAFDTTALRGLVPRPAAALLRSAGPGGAILLESRFDRHKARAETGRLYYLWLARTHFFSALAGLAALAVLGLSQNFGPALPAAVPAAPAVLLLIGLLLLAFLARLAIDVTVEPLIEAISRVPAERAEAGLLRRAVELLGNARTGAGEAGGPTASTSERLLTALEESRHAETEAIRQLSAAAEALTAAARSSVESIDAALRRLASPDAAAGRTDAGEFVALQHAVETLTAVLHRVTAASAEPRPEPVDADIVGSASPPDIADELKRLLQEI